MRSRHTLAIAGLVVAAPVALLPTEPTLAVLNDVVTVEVEVAAWRPSPVSTSTTGQPPEAAPVAADPFSPLIVPAPADASPVEQVAPTPEPESDPAEQDGSAPGTPETGGSTVEPEDGATEPEPAVVPDVDTTVSPAEVAAPASGTEGTGAGDGVAPTSPTPTSDG